MKRKIISTAILLIAVSCLLSLFASAGSGKEAITLSGYFGLGTEGTQNGYASMTHDSVPIIAAVASTKFEGKPDAIEVELYVSDTSKMKEGSDEFAGFEINGISNGVDTQISWDLTNQRMYNWKDGWNKLTLLTDNAVRNTMGDISEMVNLRFFAHSTGELTVSIGNVYALDFVKTPIKQTGSFGGNVTGSIGGYTTHIDATVPLFCANTVTDETEPIDAVELELYVSDADCMKFGSAELCLFEIYGLDENTQTTTISWDLTPGISGHIWQDGWNKIILPMSDAIRSNMTTLERMTFVRFFAYTNSEMAVSIRNINAVKYEKSNDTAEDPSTLYKNGAPIFLSDITGVGVLGDMDGATSVTGSDTVSYLSSAKTKQSEAIDGLSARIFISDPTVLGEFATLIIKGEQGTQIKWDLTNQKEYIWKPGWNNVTLLISDAGVNTLLSADKINGFEFTADATAELTVAVDNVTALKFKTSKITQTGGWGGDTIGTVNGYPSYSSSNVAVLCTSTKAEEKITVDAVIVDLYVSDVSAMKGGNAQNAGFDLYGNDRDNNVTSTSWNITNSSVIAWKNGWNRLILPISETTLNTLDFERLVNLRFFAYAEGKELTVSVGDLYIVDYLGYTDIESVEFSESEDYAVYGQEFLLPVPTCHLKNEAVLDSSKITVSIEKNDGAFGWREVLAETAYESGLSYTFTQFGSYRAVYRFLAETGVYTEHFNIDVTERCTSLSIDTSNVRTTIVCGEELDLSKLQVMAIYPNIAPKGMPVSDFTVDTDYVKGAGEGSYTVFISYTDRMGNTVPGSFEITVSANAQPSYKHTVHGSIYSYDPSKATTVILSNETNEYKLTLETSDDCGISEQSFIIENIPDGVYNLKITKDGHLPYFSKRVVVNGEADLSSDNIVLVAGDINEDGFVDSVDITSLSYDMGKNGADALYDSDINGDGYRDAIDVSVLAFNLLKSAVTVDTGDDIADRASLECLKITSGDWKTKEEINENYLKALDVDRLLYPYYEIAGKSSHNTAIGATPYPDWESDANATGITAGHYMSALSMLYVQYGTQWCKDRVDYMVDALEECQDENGYCCSRVLSQFDDVENGTSTNVPWYYVHKVMAGLVDAYRYCGNQKALEVALGLVNWTYSRVSDLTEAQRMVILGPEWGGLGESLYDMYVLTGSDKALYAARFFNDPRLLDKWSVGDDNITDVHGNSTIPKATAFVYEYMISGDLKYLYAAENFFDMVVGKGRTFANGGNTQFECFRLENVITPYCDEQIDRPSETCNIYNMIKLAQYLYELTGDIKYADYIERALFNGIMGSMSSDGGKTYYQYMQTNASKLFHAPQGGFWCCTGTGMENFAKVAQAVYYNTESGAFRVIAYINSEYDDGSFALTTEASDDFVMLTVNSNGYKRIELRVPFWAENAEITVNGQAYEYIINDNGMAVIDRMWTTGDKIEMAFDSKYYTEATPDDPDTYALYHGPYLLCAVAELENNQINGIYNNGWMGDIESFISEDGNGNYTLSVSESSLDLKRYGLVDKEIFTVYFDRID